MWSEVVCSDAIASQYLAPHRVFKYQLSWVDLSLVLSFAEVIRWQYETGSFAMKRVIVSSNQLGLLKGREQGRR